MFNVCSLHEASKKMKRQVIEGQKNVCKYVYLTKDLYQPELKSKTKQTLTTQ